uniref:Uncharacterized protein n=1 Tax=Brassica oleracea var. oleracea TaxID=109376 RepID=A0A0D3CNC2_BRAOL
MTSFLALPYQTGSMTLISGLYPRLPTRARSRTTVQLRFATSSTRSIPSY